MNYPAASCDEIFSIIPIEIEGPIDIHFVLEANPLEILSRRTLDIGFRDRGLDLDLIIKEVNAERNEAIRISTNFDKPFYILHNEETEQTAKRIIDISESSIQGDTKGGIYEGSFSHIERG